MIAIIVKVQGTEISVREVDKDITWYDFEELVHFENFGKDLIIDDMVDIEVPEVNTRYKLVYIHNQVVS